MMKYAVVPFAILSACILTACGPQIVVMRNPQTAEIVQCQNAGAHMTPMIDAMAASDCAKGYAKVGWERMN